MQRVQGYDQTQHPCPTLTTGKAQWDKDTGTELTPRPKTILKSVTVREGKGSRLPGQSPQSLVPGSRRAGARHSRGLAAISQGCRASQGRSPERKEQLYTGGLNSHFAHAMHGQGQEVPAARTLHPSRSSGTLYYYYYYYCSVSP